MGTESGPSCTKVGGGIWTAERVFGVHRDPSEGRYIRRSVFLKSLTLKGFKSFADTTTLDLEPGVTVVVGPNGSGKSNIVDAVAWVLGAQGPRTVRSTKMEDVIFAGSAKRPALGRAEVSLTIDNSAGLLPIEFTEVTITRTLFRSGDSEYAINGVPCRLLDVQELLSDTGVGRQQHVIVGQGQIDAVLNAQPDDRRLIVEEAAGVLKYRKRREKAQRRLESTEGNLLRLQDLLREVRRQLRPLERQADAARRHGDLADELTAVRRFLAGRELATLEGRLVAAARTKVELSNVDGQLRTALARYDTDVLAAEAELSAERGDRGDELGDGLLRAEGLRERARGLVNLLGERRRSVERERNAHFDQGLVASLEADAARLTAELQEVTSQTEALAPQSEEVAAAEAALASERDAFELEWGDDAPLSAGSEAAEVRGELSALRSAVERGRSELARLESRLSALGQKDEALCVEADRLRAQVDEAQSFEETLDLAVREAIARREQAESKLARAEALRVEAETDRRSWDARADALALALDDARARAGAERLSGVEGVVGTLLELVEVDEGWEAAFEAAAGEAVAAVIVDGVDAARRSLQHLASGDAKGAVLALPAPGTAGPPTGLPIFGEPVRNHVRTNLPGLERLLDMLLATAVVADGDWADALDLALAQPDLVVVTPSGDRFAPTGWRTGAAGSGATGAALDEARTQAAHAAERAADAKLDVDHSTQDLENARRDEAAAVAALDDNDSRLTGASDALQRIEAERRDVATESGSLRSRLDELVDRLDRDGERVAELEAVLPGLEQEEAAGAERVLAQRSARSRLEERATAVRTLRGDFEVRAAGLDERRTFLTRRLEEVDERLRRNQAEREDAEDRRRHLDAAAIATERLLTSASARLATVDEVVARLRQQRAAHVTITTALADKLELLRRERAASEKQLAETRERAQRVELDEAEARVRMETLVEAVRRDLDCEPEAAMATAQPELPPGTSAPNRLRELERELRLLGPINPLALEEFTALQERHQFLEGQLEDVRSSRRELAKVIKAIDSEIVEVFSAAYADVADHFEKLFATLFPGGTGRLRLTDPDNMLETGIEVEARPSGKNVRKLSLLSGGERSLTAMAFLFAVFRSRPSPFYLMDEVEAALDDVNLHRFLDLVHEFRDEAQLLVVSHQKRTMEAADCLYGVTMVPGGSSRVVSESMTTAAP
jgi:chromosome segregation protein